MILSLLFKDFFLEKKNTNARKVDLGVWLHSLDYIFGNG